MTYTLFYLFINFVYTIIFIYNNISKMVLNRYIVCFFLVFGLLVDNFVSYYGDLFLLYTITITKNYVKYNDHILYHYPYVKLFLIGIMDFATLVLLDTIIGTIASTTFSIIKNFFGYIVKMLGGPSNGENRNNNGNNDGWNPNGNNPNNPNNNKINISETDNERKKRLSKKENKRYNDKKSERTEEQKKITQSVRQKEGLG